MKHILIFLLCLLPYMSYGQNKAKYFTIETEATMLVLIGGTAPIDDKSEKYKFIFKFENGKFELWEYQIPGDTRGYCLVKGSECDLFDSGLFLFSASDSKQRKSVDPSKSLSHFEDCSFRDIAISEKSLVFKDFLDDDDDDELVFAYSFKKENQAKIKKTLTDIKDYILKNNACKVVENHLKSGTPSVNRPTTTTTTTTTTRPTTTTTTTTMQAVDLGLSVKWANCNVGARSPELMGNYYAWGEVNTKTDYSQNTYRLNLHSIPATAQYDAARKNLGGTWRLPTKTEMEELLHKCKWYWHTVNGIPGFKVVAPNGNYIFLPANGHRSGKNELHYIPASYYWTSSPTGTLVNIPAILFISQTKDGTPHIENYSGNPWEGYSVRAVCK